MFTLLTNAPIGLWPNLEFEGETFEDIRGRKLFLYSDGLNEAEDNQKLQFGDNRIIEIIGHCGPTATSKEVVDTLREAVEQHRKGAEPNDDLTMMCLRVS